MPNRGPARTRPQGGFDPGARVGSTIPPATAGPEEWSSGGSRPRQNPAYRPSARHLPFWRAPAGARAPASPAAAASAAPAERLAGLPGTSAPRAAAVAPELTVRARPPHGGRSPERALRRHRRQRQARLRRNALRACQVRPRLASPPWHRNGPSGRARRAAGARRSARPGVTGGSGKRGSGGVPCGSARYVRASRRCRSARTDRPGAPAARRAPAGARAPASPAAAASAASAECHAGLPNPSTPRAAAIGPKLAVNPFRPHGRRTPSHAIDLACISEKKAHMLAHTGR
jgi:hypothetical protein